MVNKTYLYVFIKDLMCTANEHNLTNNSVNINQWIYYMKSWQRSKLYLACYPIFVEMIDQIIQPLSKNTRRIITAFGNKISLKHFTTVLNLNESILNLNESWENPTHREAVIIFLIESFKTAGNLHD